jgi:EAL domain-containing protein (putative c-di-GMP-specific phosphodiesterase class I)
VVAQIVYFSDETSIGAAHTLEELASRGTSVAIDDFGFGYPSLAYLEQPPSRFLKIDRSCR